MSVKIAAAMPKGNSNGLKGQEDRLEGRADHLVPLVVLVEVAEIGRVLSTDEPTVKLRMAEVEIVDDEEARKLLRAGRKDRTGSEELDGVGFDGEGDDDDDN